MFKRQLRCSFCRKRESEVAKLVAGPRVYICDQCVIRAKRIMESDLHDDTELPKAKSSPWPKLVFRVREFLRGSGDPVG
jgi:ATP-dependent Clp protease ATP-binding subunit ClpX